MRFMDEKHRLTTREYIGQTVRIDRSVFTGGYELWYWTWMATKRNCVSDV